ncbi:MAG: D-alanyl-D-alanine carboxypeptidase/D-alanyl-D-alanine-endopeptidase [Phycisphaerales bacterium]|nr:D-alanyl-D-alanine carboxypeptidase/D-alanyl-D-alanine-endopeptidase [Phycisphaerales bacterium]
MALSRVLDRVGVGLAALVGVLAVAGSASAQPLQNAIEALFRDSGIGATKMGAIVIDAGTQRVLAEVNADQSYIPASNMKVVTSGAALRVLGPDFEFVTKLNFDSANNRAVVIGSGDPAFGDPKLLEEMGISAEDLLDIWAKALRDAGFKKGGELVIDDRVFDREYVHPTWPTAQLNRWYCAEVAGVNFHTNILTIFAKPSADGQPPVLRTEPESPWLEIRNRGRSISKGQQTAWAARGLNSNDITFNGDTRSGSTGVDVALHENPGVFGRMLATRMAAMGIEPEVVRLADATEDFSKTATVHSVRTEMRTVLERCNTDSYNLYAECMMKRIGQEVTGTPGSWRTGAAVVRMQLQETLGPSTGHTFVVADGSGMSRENRVTPRAMTEWLAAMNEDTLLRDAFIGSLATPKKDGTLEKRFRQKSPRNDMYAKTGYLTGVSALSGYLIDPDTDRTLIFSIISNDKPSSIALSNVRALEEKIVLMADEYLERSTARPAIGG